jgi:hypothetical protein
MLSLPAELRLRPGGFLTRPAAGFTGFYHVHCTELAVKTLWDAIASYWEKQGARS